MIGKWLAKWRICLCVTLLGFSGASHSAFHFWVINEVYSDASGAVQFIEFTTTFGGQQFLATHFLTGTSNYVFPTNLPSDTTNRKFLVGTSGFAALNIVTPDYILPNNITPANFLALTNGTINFSNVDIFNYASLPTDGVLSLNRNMTTGTNSPTNFAGTTGTIPPPTVPGAPTIGTSTAGNSQVSVTFSAPGNNGGAAIASYTATCPSKNFGRSSRY